MDFLKRRSRKKRWKQCEDPGELTGDEYVAILLLSQEESIVELTLPHFTTAQVKRLLSLIHGAQFPPRIGTLVLARFLGVKEPEKEGEKAEDYLSHLKAALEGYIKSSPRKAARAIETNLPDWRPSSIADPRPGPWDYASFSHAEKAVVVARTFDFESGVELQSKLNAAGQTNFSRASNHLPSPKLEDVELVVNELQEGIPDGTSYRELGPKRLAELLSKTWPELCCPERALKNAELMAAERGPFKVNPLIRRMFEKKKPKKPLINRMFDRSPAKNAD